MGRVDNVPSAEVPAHSFGKGQLMEVRHTFITGPFDVAANDIVDFARLWDPQPFHVSADAARASAFGGLVGSGLHSLCILVKLGTESGFLTENAIAGLAIETRDESECAFCGQVRATV